MEKLARVIVKFKWLTIIAVIGLTIVLGYQLKNIIVDLVWQYCTLGCNICKTDGFIRVTTDNKFKYCLGEKTEISFKKELNDRDSKGLMNKFDNAISKLGDFSN